jgi:two-component system, cell cycle response regulator
VTIESFRRAMGAPSADYELRVIDGRTGRVIIDGSRRQRIGRQLGEARDRRFVKLADAADEGIAEIDGRRAAYRRIERTVGNANDWIVVANAKVPTGSVVSGMGPAPIIVLALGLIIVALASVSVRAARRELESHANTDALTGLGNRRKLLFDLDRCVRSARAGEPAVLTLFDLNGFKNYNDSFGHPAGDALLMCVGSALATAVQPFGGQAYRPGGDEFCVIADAAHQRAMEQAASESLSEQGEGFTIGTAFGSVRIPQDTGDTAEALRKADQAMYAQKQTGRATADRQSSDVLLRALSERHPDLGDHQNGVAELAEQLGERLGVAGEPLSHLRHAAALHDIGKVAIPDAIITKAGPLSDDEWAFMRRHTVIGERILAAAPSLGAAASLVRSSHEAWDGSGYPDGLSDVEIPLGARVIAVCDAFDAMVSERSYACKRTEDQALDELRRCAGSQFDPRIVATFEQLLVDRAQAPIAGATS